MSSWQARPLPHVHVLPTRKTIGKNHRGNTLAAVDAAPAGQLMPIQHNCLGAVEDYGHHEALTPGTRSLLFHHHAHRFDSIWHEIHSASSHPVELCIVVCITTVVM
ncbi:MAG: hypothetical protein HC801_09575 [Nitrospira sp.]|nr:hypothetical protein [Nitrospira sp.]